MFVSNREKLFVKKLEAIRIAILLKRRWADDEQMMIILVDQIKIIISRTILDRFESEKFETMPFKNKIDAAWTLLQAFSVQ